MLRKEIGTARNIKDKKTRRKVLKSLSKIIKAVQTQSKTDNGYFVFANGKDAWIVEPTIRNVVDDYYCGKRFRSELLDEDPGVFKLYLSIKEAKLMHAIGSSELLLHTVTSGIPGDQNQGGQSQGRIHRKREEAIAAFFKRVRAKCLVISKDWEVSGEKSTVKRYENG